VPPVLVLVLLPARDRLDRLLARLLVLSKVKVKASFSKLVSLPLEPLVLVLALVLLALVLLALVLLALVLLELALLELALPTATVLLLTLVLLLVLDLLPRLTASLWVRVRDLPQLVTLTLRSLTLRRRTRFVSDLSLLDSWIGIVGGGEMANAMLTCRID